jgi:hypothetical protein
LILCEDEGKRKTVEDLWYKRVGWGYGSSAWLTLCKRMDWKEILESAIRERMFRVRELLPRFFSGNLSCVFDEVDCSAEETRLLSRNDVLLFASDNPSRIHLDSAKDHTRNGVVGASLKAPAQWWGRTVDASGEAAIILVAGQYFDGEHGAPICQHFLCW